MQSKKNTFILKKKESDDDKIGSKNQTFCETSVAV